MAQTLRTFFCVRSSQFLMLIAFAFFAYPPELLAQGWESNLNHPKNAPGKFLAIDKSKQSLMVFERHSPLKLKEHYECATGQILGDKEAEGDLKTPEGVYFVQNTRTDKLDFDLYGDMAFTLNFPNPVDIIKGKTGYGIWIHGRGLPLAPNVTRGCVALKNPDIHKLAPEIQKHLPVYIADKIIWKGAEQSPIDPEDELVSAKLIEQTEKWAKAWTERSEDFFIFHDQEKYSLAHGESFAAFRAHKEDLFRRMSWIQVHVDNLKIVKGPDYWITYFDQLYRSPAIATEGVKRLYWQKNEKDQWLIVGMEWISDDRGLSKKYLESLKPGIVKALESWRSSWEEGQLETYLSFYTQDARQGNRRGLKAIEDHKKKLWPKASPQKVHLSDIKITLHGDGIAISFIQEFSSTERSDKGQKTLLLSPHKESWKIVDENWKSI